MNKSYKKLLIESDNFDFEFLSKLAEKESWRKEVHRPIYHMHKWWATRLGSVFRGIILGSITSDDKSLAEIFYSTHNFSNISIFDPFMGSGTTIGEAHKLGATAYGKDINPVAVESVRVAFSTTDTEELIKEFNKLSISVGGKILDLYKSTDSQGKSCDVLYYFWVMQVSCTNCTKKVNLFPSWVIARNAYPSKHPEIQIVCPSCENIFQGLYNEKEAVCTSCKYKFLPTSGIAKGSKAVCNHCNNTFSILESIEIKNSYPDFKLFGKLILTGEKKKMYLKTTKEDLIQYENSVKKLEDGITNGTIHLPDLDLEKGYNTNQAISYGFRKWINFFNARQLLGLSWLNFEISKIENPINRDIFLILFSGILEFNNMFASYKGEGTGAVRHMFSHHILKPEKTPIEANIWGTPKSSGSFSNLFKSRILNALDYHKNPTELSMQAGEKAIKSSYPFTGKIELDWSVKNNNSARSVYLSCGDSAKTDLTSQSIDLIITDPPFFDNVHYSELADFFYAWQKLVPRGFISNKHSTRSHGEVQDKDSMNFALKLQGVFLECNRVLKDEGILVFSYHHSKDEGWEAVAKAIINAGFKVVNIQPVKSEMSGATPKSQASEPIQLDIIIVCRKIISNTNIINESLDSAVEKALNKISRLQGSGFILSKNDRKIILYGQILTVLKSHNDLKLLSQYFEEGISIYENHLDKNKIFMEKPQKLQ